MSNARPFHMPGARALSWVRQRARAALAAWSREWVSGTMNDAEQLATLSVEAACAEDRYSDCELEELRGTNGNLWFRRSQRDRQKFGEAVVSAELMPHSVCADDWIAAIADEAWTARNRSLCEALVGASRGGTTQQSGWPQKLTSPGSGAVTIRFEPWGLLAIADAGVWSQVPPPATRVGRLSPLVPLEHATVRTQLRVEVTLGDAELKLPRLMDLQPGDVLRLQARLDEPVRVLCEGVPFARASLGDVTGSKSIQITGKHP